MSLNVEMFNVFLNFCNFWDYQEYDAKEKSMNTPLQDETF